MNSHSANVRSALHTEARRWAASGIAVFPCAPKSKKPLTQHGFHDATTHLEQIDRWWTSEPAANIAFNPHSVGWCIIDVDGAEGEAALARLQVEHGELPPTYEVRTPRGGRHLYYLGELPMTAWRPGARRCLGEHIDTRGVGSYALVPPSVTEHGTYKVIHDREMAEVPAWVAKLLERREQAAPAVVEDLDLSSNLARAATLLRGYAERGDVAIEGQGGNTRTFQVACEVLNLGVSPDKAVTLIAEHWNPLCKPPWSQGELKTLVANAVSYAQNEPGAWATRPASEVFAGALEKLLAENGEETQTTIAAISGDDEGFPIYSPFQFKDRPEPRWIVDQLVRDKGAHINFGLSESFKSFFLLDILASVATGKPAFGKFEVFLPGDAVYCCDEDPDDMMKIRWPAWCSAHGIADPFATDVQGPGRFTIAPRCPLVSDPNEIERLIRQIRKSKLTPKVIGIDTLAKAAGGLDQNDAKNAGLLAAAATRLRREFNCAVWFTHHPKKADPHGMRGSGALENDFDVVVESMRRGDSFAITMNWHKLKGAPKPAPQHFDGKLYGVHGARDQHGKQITAPVFQWVPAPHRPIENEPGNQSERLMKDQVIAALRTAIERGKQTLTTQQVAEWICLRDGVGEADRERRIRSETRAIQRGVKGSKKKLGSLSDLVELDSRGDPIEPYRFILPDMYRVDADPLEPEGD